MLLVESRRFVESANWHRQRLHLVLSAMEHFAHELRAEGFEVDHRHAATLHQGLLEHRAEFAPAAVVAMEPHRWDTRERFARWGEIGRAHV